MTGGPLRLLIDACLTPTIPSHLTAAFGEAVDAVHVDRVLPIGTPDAAVLDWAVAEGRLLITANGIDFKALIRSRPDHPGLGLVTDQDTRTRQARSGERLMGALLARRAANRALAGHVFTWTRAGRLLVRRAP